VRKATFVFSCFVLIATLGVRAQAPTPEQPAPASLVTAIKAGRLVDPETGTAATNQIILIEGETIKAVGANVPIPSGATVIDLSKLTVMPGLVDAHNHMALTHSTFPPIRNSLLFNYITKPTPFRAIEAASNAIQMLNSGFTVVRDLGNAGNYVDTALREAIEQGWIPGPTIVNSGIIIAPTGGQFRLTPEMAQDKNLIYPEYLEADTPDEIVKAVRQNVLFGAKVIKIAVDAQPYMYTVDELKLFVTEAAKAGLRVAAHHGSVEGAKRAIEAGVWSIEHSGGLDDANHKMMAQKGIWRAGTETPVNEARGNKAAFERSVARLKNAYENRVPLVFSTDGDTYIPGKTRGEVVLTYLPAWKAAALPVPEILKALTINGYKVCELDKVRGPIKPGLAADIIAVLGNPLEDIETVHRVEFVMKDGLVFKRDGAMTPEKFFNGGPVRQLRPPLPAPARPTSAPSGPGGVPRDR
jgi:imidazolonepropionase-like amidohydrolase